MLEIKMKKGEARALRINEEIDYIMNQYNNGMISFTIDTIEDHLKRTNIPFSRKNIMYDLDKMTDEGGLTKSLVKNKCTYTMTENLKYINYLSCWKRTDSLEKRRKTLAEKKDIITEATTETIYFSFSDVMKCIDEDVIIKSLQSGRMFTKNHGRIETYPTDSFDPWFTDDEIDGEWTYEPPKCPYCGQDTEWIHDDKVRIQCTNEDCKLTMRAFENMPTASKHWKMRL